MGFFLIALMCSLYVLGVIWPNRLYRFQNIFNF